MPESPAGGWCIRIADMGRGNTFQEKRKVIRVRMQLLSYRHFRVALRRRFLKKGLKRLPLMQDNAFTARAASGIHIQHKPHVI